MAQCVVVLIVVECCNMISAADTPAEPDIEHDRYRNGCLSVNGAARDLWGILNSKSGVKPIASGSDIVQT